MAVIAPRVDGRMQRAAIGGVNAPLIFIAARRENEPEAGKTGRLHASVLSPAGLRSTGAL
ncbi:hypothetical protein [Lysobacter capsici]|uniref:hypothetical protein n=1 Tax=Lysobacter capsici TaxID=435897 RepID=UPI001C00230D|nr:hypothetical protein [Lysobacter capsici]QWF15402.1 hypothetical protein KME82_16630 [Lysobacter capsici]